MRRYAVCGLSGRALEMYVKPLLEAPELGQVVAIIDIDRERVEMFNRRQGLQIPYYTPDEFDQMVRTTGPDALIVTSTDVTHAGYIVAGLRRDLDVLAEKPMVVDCRQAAQVLDAERASGGTLRVTHNYRYQASHMHIKRLISEGKIGRVTNVEMSWNLDTYHGASYFWRWNRLRAISGGLTITKSCHHFDLLNWWLDDVPELVFAFGGLNYYGPKSPHNPSAGEGGTLSPDEQRARSPYERRWPKDTRDDHITRSRLPYQVQYPAAERPMYLFDEAIEIEDTYSAVIRYRGGASVAYSLNASAPWEGYVLGINGTHGRIEAVHHSAPARLPFPVEDHETVTLMPLFGDLERSEFPIVRGGHGGADEKLRHELFVGDLDEGAGLGLAAHGFAGACAVAVGEAVWRSVVEGRPISISELLPAAGRD